MKAGPPQCCSRVVHLLGVGASSWRFQPADDVHHEVEQLHKVGHIAACRQTRLNVVLHTTQSP